MGHPVITLAMRRHSVIALRDEAPRMDHPAEWKGRFGAAIATIGETDTQVQIDLTRFLYRYYLCSRLNKCGCRVCESAKQVQPF